MAEKETEAEVLVEAKKSSKKKADTAAANKNKFNFGDFVKAHIAEFKRIIWPTKETVIKETIVVIVLSLIVGIFIIALDLAFTEGYNALLTMVGKG